MVLTWPIPTSRLPTSRKAVATFSATTSRRMRRSSRISAKATARSATSHSYETGSRVDGPGVRITLFLSGCPLRCQYCHNPDTWKLKHGVQVTLERVVTRLGHFAPALRAMKGGLTISGGEPLVQAAFSRRILGAAKSLGLHTAIETSGFLGERATDEYLKELDLVILDIKSGDPETYLPRDPAAARADVALRRTAGGDGQACVGPLHARAGADG